MSENKKLTEEQLKQLQMLQALLKQGGKGMPGGMGVPGSMGMMGPGGMNAPMTAPQRPPLYTPRGLLIATLHGMQGGVKFIDQFINFIVNRKPEDTNDVIAAARSPIIFGFWIIFIFVFLGSIWAATAPLDSAAVAIGTVISNTKKRVINHSEGGIIKDLYVNVGDEVKQGDKLLKFDDKRVRSEFESIQSLYRNALAAESRLISEINDLEKVEYPEFLLKNKSDPEVSKIIETQDNLFHSKMETIKTESEALKQRIMQSQNQIEGYKARKVASQKTLEVVIDRLDASKKLNKQGFAQKAAVLEYEEREARALSEIAITDTEIAKTEQQITEFQIGLINLKSKSVANALSELKEVQTRLPEFAERYREYVSKLDLTLVKSPVDGLVNKVEYTTVGSTVQPYATIIEISPKNDKLIIEAKINPKNIDSIREGLESKVKFSAFKSRVSPTFIGKVVSVSPDIVVEYNKPQPDQSLMAGYYLAQIELDAEDFDKKAGPRQLQLKPGMQAEVQIITGTRTLLRYLLDPVYDAMFKGFKER